MRIYESGKHLIALLYALMKAVQVYDVNNDVVQRAAKKLVFFMNTILNIYSQIELVRYRDYIFFNKQRLRFEIDGYASLQFVHDRLKKLGLKSLTIMPGINKEEIILFTSIFKEEKERFKEILASQKFSNVNTEFVVGEEETPDFLQNGQRIKRTYFKALKVTRNLMQNLWANQPVDVRNSKRVVYSLLDSLSQDEFGLLALTTIKNFDEYTYNHSLNVGILSMAIGQRIGLSRKELAELGASGLLHDIGKVRIPKELIYKPGKLNDKEWEILKHHSDFGVKEILNTRGLDEAGLTAMTVSYQHHWNFDGSGYPIHENREKPILFSKIVRIADSYDAMTTPRVYQPIPYLPCLAVRVLWNLKRTCFDPILTKVFVQLLGLYPIGSCLELSGGEIGLVIRQNEGHPESPILKIVLDQEKQKIDGEMIDLLLDPKVEIARPIYAQKYNINPATYFV